MQVTGRWTRRGSTVVLDLEGPPLLGELLAFETNDRPALRRGSRGSAVRDLLRRPCEPAASVARDR
jgi:hypothetical protein